MTRFLIVAAGGALGAVARYGLGTLAGRLAPGSAWPWGTFGANLIGGLLMGLVAGWLAFRSGAEGEAVRLFAAVGVLGGFTTFSAFSLETLMMVERRAWGQAALYASLSVALSTLAVFLGLFLVRRLSA